MVMVAIDPTTIDRSTTGTMPTTPSALPMIFMARGIHAHAPLAQTILVGNNMATRAREDDNNTITHALVIGGTMESVHTLLGHGKITAALLISQGAEMIASGIENEEDITNVPILSATSAHSRMSAGELLDNIAHILAQIRAMLAGRAEAGYVVKLRQKNGKNTHLAPPTRNSLRAITNASITMRAFQNGMTLRTGVAVQSEAGHDANMQKRVQHRSPMSPVCRMVASSRVHAQPNVRKLASGQKSPMIPKALSDTSR